MFGVCSLAILQHSALGSLGDLPHHRAGPGAEPLRQIHGARLGGSDGGDGEAPGGAEDSLQGGSLLLGEGRYDPGINLS